MRRENPPPLPATSAPLEPITRGDVVFVVATTYLMCGPTGVVWLVLVGLVTVAWHRRAR